MLAAAVRLGERGRLDGVSRNRQRQKGVSFVPAFPFVRAAGGEEGAPSYFGGRTVRKLGERVVQRAVQRRRGVLPHLS